MRLAVFAAARQETPAGKKLLLPQHLANYVVPVSPANLDPPRFGSPGPNPLADMDPPTKLSENIIFNVLVKRDDSLRSSEY